jgi:hypothetical protein
VNSPSIPMMARIIVDSVINRPLLNVWMCSDEHYRKGTYALSVMIMVVR